MDGGPGRGGRGQGAGWYLWPDGVSLESSEGFRRQVSSTDRPLEPVAPEDIANAMAALCRASAGMRRDELFTATATVFGYKRGPRR